MMRRVRPLLLAVAVLLCAACARTRTIEYPMTWSGDDGDDRVILTFSDFPNHYVDLESPGLHAYLRGLGDEQIEVTFRVTTRLGCLERLEEVRIGERDDWPKLWAGSGWVNSEKPSPWDEFRCWNPWW